VTVLPLFIARQHAKAKNNRRLAARRIAMRASLLVPAIFAVAALVAPAARADPVLQAILAQSAKAPVVGFERSMRAELRGDPEKEPASLVDRFVPKTASSGTWTLVSIDGRKPTAKEQETFSKNSADGVIPGFHRLHIVLGAPPSRRTEADGRTTYLWNSLPAGAVKTPGGDISARLSAEAQVEQVGGKPMISQVRIFAAKPFKIRGIATMHSFDVTSVYKPGAAGIPFLAAQTSASDVSAPFGMGGKRRSIVSFKPI
jgi:hypothetical protein